MLYEPPPQIQKFNWIWAKWMYGFWVKLSGLASTDIDDGTKGSNLVTHPAKIYTTEFLQTVSDINNGVPISIMRFITTASAEHSKVRARTSTTDHTTAFNNAITELSTAGGGKAIIPIGDYNIEDVVPKDGVILAGEVIGVITSSFSQVSRFVSLGNGSHIINQPSGNINNFSIDGMMFQGPGAATTGRGISGIALDRFNLSNVAFNNFADEAVNLGAGSVAGIFVNIFAQGCLLNQVRVAKIGVIHLDGTDHRFLNSEIAGAVSALSHANAYICAVVLEGGTHSLQGIIGETADVGIYANCDNAHFVNCRADLNYGNGWEITGGGNMFSNSLSLRNGRETTNTYDGWNISGVQNLFDNCLAKSLTADAWKHKYGFQDTVNSDANKNWYTNCRSGLHNTQGFLTQGFAGSSVSFPNHPHIAAANGDTTPTVDQIVALKLINSSATSITNFDNCVSGQPLSLIVTTTNTTIVNGATIKTNTGANKVLALNKVYIFTNYNGIWYENE